jgi:MFS family permease
MSDLTSHEGGSWLALLVMLMAPFMAYVDFYIVFVANPNIAHGLHASSEQIQFVVAGYTTAYAVNLITAGRLGDTYGSPRPSNFDHYSRISRHRIAFIGSVFFGMLGASSITAATDIGSHHSNEFNNHSKIQHYTDAFVSSILYTIGLVIATLVLIFFLPSSSSPTRLMEMG